MKTPQYCYARDSFSELQWTERGDLLCDYTVTVNDRGVTLAVDEDQEPITITPESLKRMVSALKLVKAFD